MTLILFLLMYGVQWTIVIVEIVGSVWNWFCGQTSVRGVFLFLSMLFHIVKSTL